MSPADHNKTLVILYSLLSGCFTLPLVGAPWIIEKNVRSSEQLPIAIAIGFPVLLLALLCLSTTLALYRRRPCGRKLALLSAVILLPLCWPVAVYTWRFMHTGGAKKMYRGRVSARVAFYS